MIDPTTVMFLSVFVQVLLTIWAIFTMGRARIGTLKSGEVRLKDIALSTDAYPDHVKKLQNNATNQFELPILFYVCTSIAFALNSANWVIAACCVVFAISRIIHRYIHVNSNHLQSRFNAYAIGLIAVLIMWVGLAYETVLG